MRYLLLSCVFRGRASAASRDWEGKARLLAQLEQKVKQMKDNFDARELKLVQERDQQVEAQR